MSKKFHMHKILNLSIFEQSTTLIVMKNISDD